MTGFVPPGFERRVRNVESREGPFTIEKAYIAAQEINAKEAIDPRTFGESFSQTGIARDMQTVRDQEKAFDAEDDSDSKRARKLSKILEIVIHEESKMGWLGADARTVLPSKFDDFNNKIDLIAELTVKSENFTAHTALGIDVTYSKDLSKKVEDIIAGIDKGEMSTVKYYQSSDGRYQGSLKKVPRLVVGVSEESATVMARAWYEKNPALHSDPLREQVLIQLIDQCRAFEQYAKTKGQEDAEAAYRFTGKFLHRAYGRPVTPQDRGRFSKDKVFAALELMITKLEQGL